MQYHHWSVCQKCGAVAPRGTFGWLDSQHKEDPELRVVRCPAHVTDHALRMSVVGRAQWRRVEALRNRTPEPLNPFAQPFPLVDEPIGGNE